MGRTGDVGRHVVPAQFLRAFRSNRLSQAPSAPPIRKNAVGEVAQKTAGIATVVLKGGKAALFKHGNPMVYSGAVDRVVGRPAPQTGDVVVLSDGAAVPIGWGLYNADSMFRVRVMQLEVEAAHSADLILNMEKLLKVRIGAAYSLREMLRLPSETTNVYRLCNSEGDGLSGLIVDVVGDNIVCASSAAWVERHKPTIVAALREVTGLQAITWRPNADMLREEGLDTPPADADAASASVDGDPLEVVEHSIRYRVDVHGQKTGFYADQRENRLFFGTITRGQRVLDLCCYTGGFALNAAAAGAAHVTGVDSSASAVEMARTNAALNGINGSVCSFERAQVSDFMEAALAAGQQWDVVMLDPPKLAPNRKSLNRASARYRKLNAQAMQLLRPGGLLMTCSCSGAMTQSGQFAAMLQMAAASLGKSITILRTAGAGPDHTLLPAYPEGRYLTNVLLRVV